jgi:tetratricopeptide (TPR) repeat protein
MKPQRTAIYAAAALFILSFGLACHLDAWREASGQFPKRSEGVLSAFLGESQGILAALLFIKADVYFHRGFYPSIFERTAGSGTSHMVSESHSSHEEHAHTGNDEHGHSHEGEQHCPKDFENKPLDWIDSLSRSFYPSVHIHADQTPQGVKELLPWLKLSAAFDPHRVETYTVAAFWLRSYLGKVDEAEEFLRDGLRANPGNPEILFELGRIYRENRKDNVRARNILELALANWRARSRNEKEPDTFLLQQILAHLAYIERDEKNYAKAIEYFTELKKYSPNPQGVEKQIEELRQHLEKK